MQKNQNKDGGYMSDGLESVPHAGVDTGAHIPASLLNVPSFDSESEEALALRFSRRPKPPQELTYEFTRDPGLLHQYHTIYEREFSASHKANYHHSADDEEQDRMSHIVVVRQGNFCIGGARISVKTPRQPLPLPIEMKGFKLEDHFPELKSKEMRYGQIGRFCLLPEFRGGTITNTLMWHAYRKVVALGLDQMFGTATIANARVYKQNCIAMGLKDVKIHRDIDLPAYPMCEEIKFYLISGSVDRAPLEKQKNFEENFNLSLILKEVI